MTLDPPTPVRPGPHELDAVVALIAAEQGSHQRMITTLGDRPDGIRAELDELDPPWTSTARVVHDDGGAVTGVVVSEWDDGLGRAWIHGPWVAGDDERWNHLAPALLAAALAQVPHAVVDRELAGEVANVRLAALADRVGWPASEVNHVLVADAGVIAAWAVPDTAGGAVVRPARAGDLEAVRTLHEAEFPGSYATAGDVLAWPADGRHVALVAGRTGHGTEAYAAGRVQPDGEGYIDFVAVHHDARRAGLGHLLVTALARRLVERSTSRRVALTVQDRRTPARALYARLGFRRELSVVGYGRRHAAAAAGEA